MTIRLSAQVGERRFIHQDLNLKRFRDRELSYHYSMYVSSSGWSAEKISPSYKSHQLCYFVPLREHSSEDCCLYQLGYFGVVPKLGVEPR